MPLFSAFTPFGMFRFSGAPSRGERIYRSMVDAKSDAFDMTIGTYEEAKTYAQAMGIARARYALERALNQLDPLKCIEMLPKLEIDWAMIPGEFDTILDRQIALAARMILSRGAVRTAIEEGLRAILGEHFVALRSLSPTESVNLTPSTCNFVRSDIPFKVIRLTEAVTLVGTAVSIPYENLDLTAGPLLIIENDVLTIEPENTELSEVITVVAATATTLTAVFTKPHNTDCLGTTQNWVNWVSTQRQLFVIVDAVAVVDSELCRRVDDFMGHVCRGVTKWDIISEQDDVFEFTGWWRA